jgi:hypothetical protein
MADDQNDGDSGRGRCRGESETTLVSPSWGNGACPHQVGGGGKAFRGHGPLPRVTAVGFDETLAAVDDIEIAPRDGGEITTDVERLVKGDCAELAELL